MSKKIVNLGKVKARTKELRLNDTVIEHKYDDEQEWQPLVDLGEAGSSINTVSGYSELPTDAKENDVAIVEEEEYVRTENNITILPIEFVIPEEDSEIPNTNINFEDNIGSILEEDELKNLGAKYFYLFIDGIDYKIDYTDISSDIAPMVVGVEHPVKVVQVSKGEGNTYFCGSGMSARDYMQTQLGIKLEEEQWTTLLGSHANDSTINNPSYNWNNLVVTQEPINEHSVNIDGMYTTVFFDVEIPEIQDMFNYVSVGIRDAEYKTIFSDSTYIDKVDSDPEMQATTLEYVNFTINHIAHGDVLEQSIDIYNPKGLFQNDNGEWVSLEEKMNTPRFVDTYADLPKTSIENGIMAVAQEDQVVTESKETTKIERNKEYKIKAINDITLDDFNSLVNDFFPENSSSASINRFIILDSIISENRTEYTSVGLLKVPMGGTVNVIGIIFDEYIRDGEEVNGSPSTIRRYYGYFLEVPLGVTSNHLNLVPPIFGQGTLPSPIYPETNKWYWFDIITFEGQTYSIDGIIHEGLPDEHPYNVRLRNSQSVPSDITKFNLRVLNLSEVTTEIYPAGFYRYNDNEWKLVKAVSGDEFANKAVLDALTAEDIGNIQLNTEARHEHSNKSYLDQIQWDTINNINQNTNARHTHSNKDTLDQIDSYKMNEINQSINQRHTHSNQSYLDQINSNTLSRIGEISSNTSARHTHSNKYTLDKISEDTITSITANTNARHYHSNTSVLQYLSESGGKLYYRGKGISPAIESRTYTDKKFASEIILEDNVFKHLDVNIPYPPINISLNELSSGGEAWFKFSYTADTKVCFSQGVWWKNNLRPPIGTGSSTIIIKIYRIGSVFYGEWFGGTLIDTRLLPVNKTSRFAKVEDGELIFAPISINGTSYNDDSLYLENGYKKVLGEDSQTLSSKLKPNDECELVFREYDDFIIVCWIVTPKGYRIGEYINSSDIVDWSNYFGDSGSSNSYRAFKGESIDDLLIGSLDTSNGTNFVSMFHGCSELKSLPIIDLSKAQSISQIFYECQSLVSIKQIICNSIQTSIMSGAFYKCINLRDVLINGKIKVDSNLLRLTDCNNLTVDSIMSFINAFEDNTGEEKQYTVHLGDENLAKLTESQIAIATSKNILLA